MDYLSLLGPLFSGLLLYKYVVLFIAVFLAGLGLPIPSGTLLVAVGAFASQDYFNLWISFIVALLANIFGDLSIYFLIRRYGARLIRKNYHKRFLFISRLEKIAIDLERRIEKHEAITIFVTRFFGLASTIVNFLSGLIPVPFKTFIIYDFLGNFLDIALLLLLGFFISESWQSVAKRGRNFRNRKYCDLCFDISSFSGTYYKKI